jgi:hypothetical protein
MTGFGNCGSSINRHLIDDGTFFYIAGLYIEHGKKRDWMYKVHRSGIHILLPILYWRDDLFWWE